MSLKDKIKVRLEKYYEESYTASQYRDWDSVNRFDIAIGELTWVLGELDEKQISWFMLPMQKINKFWRRLFPAQK